MQRRMCLGSLALGAVLVLVGSSSGHATTRMLGIKPSDGVAMLVKQFTVPAGAMIQGVRFTNNDSATTFPQVALVRGPLSTMSEGTVVASVANVRETTPGLISASWSQPVQATGTAPYYVAIRFPAGPSKAGPGVGPAIGASDVPRPNGSFLASGTEGSIMRIRADLDVTLLTGGSAGGAGGPYKASEGARETVVYRTFLGGGSPNPASGLALIEYGVEQTSEVTLSIYDVSGRQVRRLVHETVVPGAHQVSWDGRSSTGHLVAAGVYIAKLRVAGKDLTQKVVLVR